jgi:hypothetical protein
MNVIEVSRPIPDPSINTREPERYAIITTLFDPGTKRVRVFLDNITMEGARDLLERGVLPQLSGAIESLAAAGVQA